MCISIVAVIRAFSQNSYAGQINYAGFSITLILMVMQFYTKYNVNILEIYGFKLCFFVFFCVFGYFSPFSRDAPT